jgi:hypothetical protein
VQEARQTVEKAAGDAAAKWNSAIDKRR